MLDPATGRMTLSLPDGPVLGPELTRQAFLATAFGAACPVGVRNEPWCSFAVFGAAWDGPPWNGHLYFQGQRLEMMNWAIPCDHPAVAGIAEPDLVGFYEKLLTPVLGAGWRERAFPWGTVSCSYDPRSDATMVTVSYRSASPGLPRGCLGVWLAG